MVKAGMLIGGLIALAGIGTMLTPLRTYFLIGWVTGCVLLFHGLSTLGMGLIGKNRSLSKCIVGLISSVIGVVMLVLDQQNTIAQHIIVYFVAGGILLSGLVECFIGWALRKKEKPWVSTFLFGVISLGVGLAGIVFQQATVVIIGVVVGYHIFRVGYTMFQFFYTYDKPRVIDL